MDPIYHALTLDMHQPQGNLDHLLDTNEWEAKEILFAYDRMPRTLWPYEDIARVNLVMSGTLLETLSNPDFQKRAYGIVNCGSLLWSLQNTRLFEAIGSGFYHPSMALIPETDWNEQIGRWLGIAKQLFWRTQFPGFFPPDLAFDMRLIPRLCKAGYRYVLVDSEYVRPVDTMSWGETRYRPHIAEYGGYEMVVVVRDRDLSAAQLAGMEYSWFYKELQDRTRDCNFPPLVMTATPGDNGGWFRNVDEGANFWTFFYREGLDQIRAGQSAMRPTFISDYLDQFGAHGRVTVERGAWDTGEHHGWDFAQWQGSTAQRDTMKRIHDVSDRFHRVADAAAGVQQSGELARVLGEAHWHLLRAETSDHFFWGDDWLHKAHKDLDNVEWHLGEAEALLARMSAVPGGAARLTPKPPDKASAQDPSQILRSVTSAPPTGGVPMANPLFRFAIVRPPQKASDEELSIGTAATHPYSLPETPLLTALRQARAANDLSAMRARSREFIGLSGESALTPKPGFVRRLVDLNTAIGRLDAWLQRNQATANAKQFQAFAESDLQASLADITASDAYISDRGRVGDSILAVHLAAHPAARLSPHLNRAVRIFNLMELLARKSARVIRQGALREALRASAVVPGDLYPLPSVESEEEQRQRAAALKRRQAEDTRRARIAANSRRLGRLKAAKGSLLRAYERDHELKLLAQSARGRAPAEEAAKTASDTYGEAGRFLSAEAQQTLASDTTRILTELGFDVKRLHVPTAVGAIQNEISSVARDLYLPGRQGRITRIGSQLVVGRVAGYPFFGNRESEDSDDEDSEPEWQPAPCFESPGGSTETETQPLPSGPPANPVQRLDVADLMVIEQELHRYELGEIAHIENVLTGETRERTHRRARTTEETVFVETETTEETERDLETTSRFELQTEAEQVISEDTSLEVGATVTATYGWISSTLSASFVSDTSRQDSRRQATNHARDVTERAVSRVQERVLERRSRRVLEEFEETNLHKFENTAPDAQNIAGLYRWVDKIYKAQVVNYGARAVYEVVVPQPAAFLKHARQERPPELLQLEKPCPPMMRHIENGEERPLSPDDISDENYLYWVAEYNIQEVEPPPAEFVTIGTVVNATATPTEPPEDGQLPIVTKAVTDDSLKIPDCYEPMEAFVTYTALEIRTDDVVVGFYFSILIGKNAPLINVFPSIASPTMITFDTDEKYLDGNLPVVIIGRNVSGFAVSIEVKFKRNDRGCQAWQQRTYKAIVTAYQGLKTEYEDRVRAIEFEEQQAILGRNPDANRAIERTELKRSVISILTGQHFDSFDALGSDAELGYPQLDHAETAHEGPYIRFFEQAFEWENMTYLFYPFYWGRKENWIADSQLDDVDPLHAQFLRAGAARVVVPARPGFEEALCSFIAHGWPVPDDPSCPDENGNENPGDSNQLPPFLSIIDEIKAQQGYDGTPGEGTIAVTEGSANVVGTETDFDKDRDTDREIHIGGVKYRIAEWISATEINLTQPYVGPSASGLNFTLGVRYIGEPWEVRVPTSLVLLQPTSELPNSDA